MTQTFIKENTWLTRDRIDFGWGNGYVILPKGHHLHGKSYNEIDVDIHGGLTFSELVNEDVVEVFGLDSKHIGSWMIGFDTCHFNDTLEKWTKEKVQAEADLLKQRIDALNP